MVTIYDKIGINYAELRKPDPRIEKAIHEALEDAPSIVNIGAGAGSYEPKGRNVLAVEPSATMIAQRANSAAPVIQASAENLPFQNKQFDLSMAILTVHHWESLTQGLSEMKRVSNRQLIFTWDPDHPGFWLTQEYFPEILAIDKAIFPPFEEIEQVLGPMRKIPVLIPGDCIDGFGCAYWRIPEAYLSPAVRMAISTFSKIKETESGEKKLRADLESGEWERRYGHLRKLNTLDLGYTLLVN